MPSRKLVSSKPFEKAYKKFTGTNQLLKASIAKTLGRLQNDAYDPALKTHKLSGNLQYTWPARAGTTAV